MNYHLHRWAWTVVLVVATVASQVAIWIVGLIK